MRYAISLLLLPILFLIGCAAETTGGNEPTAADLARLQTHSWRLLELNGQPPVSGTSVTLNFDAEAIGGNSGCNVYGGSFELVDGRLVISDIFSTMMACMEEGVMEQEAAFHQALRDAVAFNVSGDGQSLELRNADGAVIVRLTADDGGDNGETAETATELYKQWRLVELNGQAPLPGSEINLIIDGEALSGNAGCNGYGGDYAASAGGLTVGMLFQTEIYCMADGVMDQETAYLTALMAAVAYEVSADGQTLWLRDAEGQTSLRFVASDAPESQLQNRWTLVELNGAAPLPGIEVSLNVEADSLGGNSSCNSYGGSYAVTDGKLEIGELFSTMMACLDEGVMEQEAAFHEALRAAAAFEIGDDGQSLLMRDAEGAVILRFVLHRDVTDPAELSGQPWELTTLVSNEAASSLLADSAITLEFDSAEGQLFGSAGCNNYNAGYSLDGERLTIGPAASTRMYCEPEGLMEQEGQYLSWLEEVEGYELNGRQLTLTLSEGRQLIFTAK
jgi:heat shock protein HslJ